MMVMECLHNGNLLEHLLDLNERCVLTMYVHVCIVYVRVCVCVCMCVCVLSTLQGQGKTEAE